ncbi:matrixin family metalloprotease [Aeoliella sp.]|uniref:matrixin family metalloprotease n=1 Tax=Aeoliella sp. TaxID=2795800 RepID=UPI003CCBB2D6
MNCLRLGLYVLLACCTYALLPGRVCAYVVNGRWAFTATDGLTAPYGNPVTLTWSIVPDGTTISHRSQPSDLVSFLDDIFDVEQGGSDYQARPWFDLLDSSFQRWSEVSGVVLEYEPFDDGLTGHPHGNWLGAVGVRGDIRLGGTSLDGPAKAYAETGFIPNGDITIDTDDAVFYGTAGAGNTYLNLRNTLTHEIGHSLGLGHTVSPSSGFLMESGASSMFDGPQFDDILGAHYLYGDRLETAGGNNTPETAHPLGSIAPMAPQVVGIDATVGVGIAPEAMDFVSISDSSDVDYFSFTTVGPTKLDLVLTPAGPTYNEFIFGVGIEDIDASMLGDLSLELYAESGGEFNLLATVNQGGIGDPESIVEFDLPAGGTYLARVASADDAVQFYTLSFDVQDAETYAGDYNDDGTVNLADYVVWRNHFGAADDSSLLFRGDGVPGIDAGDYQVWVENLGVSYGESGTASHTIPEPTAALMVLLSLLSGAVRRQRASSQTPGQVAAYRSPSTGALKCCENG